MMTITKIYRFQHISVIKEYFYVRSEDKISDSGLKYVEFVGKELMYQTDSWEDGLLAIEENRTDLIEALNTHFMIVEERLGAFHCEVENIKFFRTLDADTFEEVQVDEEILDILRV